jgi:hypothetical protein
MRKLRVFPSTGPGQRLCQSAPQGYASQDKPIVRELYQKLAAEGWVEPFPALNTGRCEWGENRVYNKGRGKSYGTANQNYR